PPVPQPARRHRTGLFRHVGGGQVQAGTALLPRASQPPGEPGRSVSGRRTGTVPGAGVHHAETDYRPPANRTMNRLLVIGKWEKGEANGGCAHAGRTSLHATISPFLVPIPYFSNAMNGR